MSDTFSKVEVITGVARRRRFSTDLKLAVIAETMQPGMSISYVARRYGLSPSLVFRWRLLMSEGGKEAVRADDEVVAASEVRRLEERVRRWSACSAARRWKSRSSRRRSNWRGQENRSCCRPRRFREIPGENDQRDIRCGPLECRRAPGWQEAVARPTRATRRCRACWRNPPLCRYAGIRLLERRDRACRVRPRLPRPRGDLLGCNDRRHLR